MDFWLDHGGKIKDTFQIGTLVIGFGILIFKQGKFAGNISSQVDKNCKGLTAAKKDIKKLEESELLTRPEHHDLTIDCRKEIKNQMDAKDKEYDRRLTENCDNLKSITKSIADGEKERSKAREEDNKRWTSVQKTLTKNTTVLELVQKQFHRIVSGM